MAKIRKVGDKSITCFDIRYLSFTNRPIHIADKLTNSSDGRFLAFGSSDYTIGMLDSTTLAVCLDVVSVYGETDFVC